MSNNFHTLYFTTPHDRPDFRLVQAFLWGDDKNTDSDGNALSPASRKWTELTLELRGLPSERFSIDEYKIFPLTLKVKSENKFLATHVAYLLAHYTSGKVSHTPTGLYENPESLLPEMGEDFDLEKAFDRFQNSPFQKSSLENPYPNLRPNERPRTIRGMWLREWLYHVAMRILKIVNFNSRKKE